MTEINKSNTEDPRLSFRRTMGAFLTGVTIVTTTDKEGRPRGMTANSFTSVSLDPPLVLVCIGKSAASYEAFLSSDGYAVHVLGSDQLDLAKRFASPNPEKFEGVDFCTGHGGAPLLNEANSWIDCETKEIVDAGDHAIIIGQVLDHHSTNQRPLGFHQGKLATFDPEVKLGNTPEENQKLTVGWIAEDAEGRIAIEKTPHGSWNLPGRYTTSESLDNSSLNIQASEDLSAEVEVHFLYSMFNRTSPARLVLMYRASIESHDLSRSDSNLDFVHPKDIDFDRFEERTDKSVLRRYLKERIEGGFGFYAGSEKVGNVASIQL